jgi:hypothetical protein
MATNLAVNVPQGRKNVHTVVKVASNFLFYEGNFSIFSVGLFPFELTLKVDDRKICSIVYLFYMFDYISFESEAHFAMGCF